MDTTDSMPRAGNTYGIRDAFTHWRVCEVLWLALATLSVLVVSVLLGDNLLGISSSVTGIICVVLTAKGKLAAYYFGVANCILYAIVAYGQTLYGETLLNALYYLPLQFIGFHIWRTHINAEQGTVQPLHMAWRARVYALLALVAGTALLGVGLAYFGDAIPYVDAYTTVASVFAMTLSARRCPEQWYLWISINVCSIYMWAERFAANGENVATLMMWVVFLVNSVFGLVKWTRK